MWTRNGTRAARTGLRRHAVRILRRLPDLTRDYVYALRHHTHLLRRVLPVASTDQPVLLLPGIYETAAFLKPLRRALEAEGCSVHAISALRLNLAEPARLADVVVAYLDEHDLDDVVCVAHSKGGLLAKQLLVDPRTHGRIVGAVTLCTPFSGSGWGRLFVPGLGVRDLSPGARGIMSLDAVRDVNARIVSIYPSVDPHIPEGSWLDGAENVEIDAFGHFQVLSDRRFLEATVDAVHRLRAAPRLDA